MELMDDDILYCIIQTDAVGKTRDVSSEAILRVFNLKLRAFESRSDAVVTMAYYIAGINLFKSHFLDECEPFCIKRLIASKNILDEAFATGICHLAGCTYEVKERTVRQLCFGNINEELYSFGLPRTFGEFDRDQLEI